MTKKAIERLPADAAGTYGPKITFTFEDGTTAEFDINSVPTHTRGDLMMHGASQKIGDSYAGAAGSDNPLAYAKAAVADTIKQLYEGEWRVTVAAGPRISDLAVALARVSGKSLDEANAFVETLDDDQKKAWRAKRKVKLALATIAAEKAAAKAAKLAASEGEDEEITLE